MSPCCFLRCLDFSTSDARDGSVRRDRGARTEAAARGAMQSVLGRVARLADSVSSDPGAGRKGELQRESGPFSLRDRAGGDAGESICTLTRRRLRL